MFAILRMNVPSVRKSQWATKLIDAVGQGIPVIFSLSAPACCRMTQRTYGCVLQSKDCCFQLLPVMSDTQ